MKLESHRTSGHWGTQWMPLLILEQRTLEHMGKGPPPFRSCSTGQGFSDFPLQQNHLESFLNHHLHGWALPQQFLVQEVWVEGPRIYIFNKLTANANDAGSESHFEKHRFRQCFSEDK